MNTNLKKALLLVSASVGMLSLSAVASDVASAGTGYASGSASVTNMDGSTYSVGGEFGGSGQSFNSVTVQPSFQAVANSASYSVGNLTVNTNGVAAATTTTISQQVVSVLNGLSSNGNTVTTANLSPYVSIIRAAGGANGLE